MKSKTCKKALNRLNNVYRIKFSRSDPPKIARGVHEGTPLWTKQDAKRQQLLCMEETGPHCGLRTLNSKSLFCDVDTSQTLLVQKLFLEFSQKKLRGADMFPNEKSII